MAKFLLISVDSIAWLQGDNQMLGQLCVIKFQNLSNLCIEHVQKHQIETVESTINKGRSHRPNVRWLRIVRERIPTFAQVLRGLDRLCVVVHDVKSAHKSRTNLVNLASVWHV